MNSGGSDGPSEPTDSTCALYFEGNGAAGSMDPMLAAAGNTVPLPDHGFVSSLAFTGWKDENGNIYQPGTDHEVTGEMTFTAQWGDMTWKSLDSYLQTQGGSGVKIMLPNDVAATESDSYLALNDDILPAGEEYTITEDTEAWAQWEEKPIVIIKGVTGSFNDKIKMNFYFDIPETVLADKAAYVVLTDENETQSVTSPVKDAKFVTGRGYKFSIAMAAKEGSDLFTARMFDGEGNPITIKGSSGTDYTETGVQSNMMRYFTWLEGNGTADEKKIGSAAKDYCSASQLYFKYKADGVSVSSAVDTVTTDILDNYRAEREGTLPDGVGIRGISGMLESDNTLRLYLEFSGVDPDSFTYSIDGAAAELKKRSDGESDPSSIPGPEGETGFEPDIPALPVPELSDGEDIHTPDPESETQPDNETSMMTDF